MRRLKIEDALRDESLAGQIDRSVPGEVVVLAVRGGEVVTVVPAGTDDDQAVVESSVLRATLRLENERVLTVEIHRGGAGTDFHDRPALLHAAQLRVAAPAPEPTAAAGPPALTAGEIMTRNVLVASPDDLVEDIAKRLAFHNISGMPVEDWDGKVIGIISEMDVIGKLHDTIRDAMSSELASASPDTPLEQVAALMAERRIKRVPVLDGDALVGIVTRADIVRAFAARSAAGA